MTQLEWTRRRRQMYEMIAEKVPIEEISKATGYSERTVTRTVTSTYGRAINYPGKKLSKRKCYVKNETLCWRCQRATSHCSWSRYYIPVEGWVAEPTTIRNPKGSIRSYCVISCPEFKEDEV